ncbi:hypothetical protein AHAS_Ahas09G0106900 [Arachis hypogaea]
MAAGNQLQRQWSVFPPEQVKNTIRREARFAILHHNHHKRLQDHQVSFSTSFQGRQREEGLPGRVEAETGDGSEAGGEGRQQPTNPNRPFSGSSSIKSIIGRNANREEADKQTNQQEIAQQRRRCGCVFTVRPGSSRQTQLYSREQHRSRPTTMEICGKSVAKVRRAQAEDILEDDQPAQRPHA